MAPKLPTREAWLEKGIDLFRDYFKSHDVTLPSKLKVSCSWSSSRSRITLGQIYYKTEDGIPQIFISPTLKDPVDVLSVLAHELLHSAFPGEGHQGLFAKAAHKIGFQSPLTKTTPNAHLTGFCRGLSKVLGEYPHSKVDPTELKKQTTRMLKIVCPMKCGNFARQSNTMYRTHETFCGCQIEDGIVNKLKLESEV